MSVSIFKKIRVLILGEMLSPTHVVAVDAEGNFGKKPILESNYPSMAPYLSELVPDTYLPSTTGNFILRGSFFTTDMGIVIEGHTINYKIFISSNEFLVNLTTSATEGLYDVTLNNGLEAVFVDQLQVVNGTVYQPLTSNDWENLSGSSLDVATAGEAHLQVYNSLSSGRWVQELDYTKDFTVSFKFAYSPLGTTTPLYPDTTIQLVKASNDSFLFQMLLREQGSTSEIYRRSVADGYGTAYTESSMPDSPQNMAVMIQREIKWTWSSGTMKVYYNNVLRYTHTDLVTENLKLKVNLRRHDIVNIKYIDLSDTGGGHTDPSKLISQFVNDVPYVKLNEISNYPLMAPYLKELVPDTYLPSTTGNFILRGSFFTSDMVITIEGHAINYQTFISSNEFLVNLTTSATEGTYDVTLNNGLQAVFADQLQVVNGTVYKPTNLEWTETEPVETDNDEVKTQTIGSTGNAIWEKELDFTKDFYISFKLKETPLGLYSQGSGTDIYIMRLRKVSDNSVDFGVTLRRDTTNSLSIKTFDYTDGLQYIGVGNNLSTLHNSFLSLTDQTIEYRFVSGTMYFYFNNILKKTFAVSTLTENVKLQVFVSRWNVYNVKYTDITDTGGGYTDPEKLISKFTNDSEYIRIADLSQYADDAAASVGGVGIGKAYINSSTGAIHSRLT